MCRIFQKVSRILHDLAKIDTSLKGYPSQACDIMSRAVGRSKNMRGEGK